MILDLDLQRYTDGNYVSKYFQKTVTVPAGAGNESDPVVIVTRDSIKLHTKNCSVYESLSSVEDVENNVAEWILISDGTVETFPLSQGAGFLKIINNSATEEAWMNVTGV